jgi:hypothetical protein
VYLAPFTKSLDILMCLDVCRCGQTSSQSSLDVCHIPDTVAAATGILDRKIKRFD